jgi:anti-anti-sigma regulatory factor
MRKDVHTTSAVVAGPSGTDGEGFAVDITIDRERHGITIRPVTKQLTNQTFEAVATTAINAMDCCPIEGDGYIIIDVSDVDSLPANAQSIFAAIARSAERNGYRPAFYGARAMVMDQIRMFGIDRSYRMYFPQNGPRAA